MSVHDERGRPANPGRILDDVCFQGRTVPAETFRAWMYNTNGERKMANSYEEYAVLSSTGLWFDTKEQASNEVADARTKPKRQGVRSRRLSTDKRE